LSAVVSGEPARMRVTIAGESVPVEPVAAMLA
jgi:hypothetical protein